MTRTNTTDRMLLALNSTDKEPIVALMGLIEEMGRELDIADEQRRMQQWAHQGQGIRVGSRVTSGGMPIGGREGVVIAIEHGYDQDGYPTIEKVRVRLDSGALVEALDDDNAIVHVEDLEDITPRQYLNVYLEDRACGGPEEGGWWYDVYEPTDRSYLLDPAEASTDEVRERLRDELQAKLDEENAERRPPSSVRSEGHFIALLEPWPANPKPGYRPHYC